MLSPISPGARILGELSPATHSFKLFGQHIESEEATESYNGYYVTIEFDEHQQLNIYFYQSDLQKEAFIGFNVAGCFNDFQLEDIKIFLGAQKFGNKRRPLDSINRQYEEFISTQRKLASPVKPLALAFGKESLAPSGISFSDQLGILRDYLAVRKTEIIFTLAGYQLRLEDFAKLLVAICKGNFPERDNAIKSGISNRYIIKRNDLKKIYDAISPHEATAITKSFVIEIINQKDCPYKDVHTEIIRQFSNYGGEVKDAKPSTAAGAGTSAVYYDCTIGNITSGVLDETINNITARLTSH